MCKEILHTERPGHPLGGPHNRGCPLGYFLNTRFSDHVEVLKASGLFEPRN